MKRVVFGYEGGFPLEQQTLMQIQEAYSEDMLEGLFALWGLDPTKKYKIEVPTSNTKDGWLILPLEVQIEGERDGSGGDKDAIKKTKLQLVRLVYDKGGKRVLIEDVRLNNGELAYADKGIKNKVYEEFVAKLVPTGGVYNIDTDFLLLTNILKLASNINSNSNHINSNTSQINSIREDYLPRDGSKPMTGDLIAEKSISVNGKVSIGVSNPNKSLEINAGDDSLKIENLANVDSQIPLVIDSNGNVGKNPEGIVNNSFVPSMIMMWSGLPSNVPTDWVLCDGRADINGVEIPDLRGRFIAGYSKGSTDYGSIKESNKGKESITLGVSNLPEHRHSMKFRYSGAEQDNQIAFLQPTHFTDSNPQGEGGGDSTSKASGKVSIYTEYSGTKFPTSLENRPPYYTLAFIIYVGPPKLEISIDNSNQNQTIEVSSSSIKATARVRASVKNAENGYTTLLTKVRTSSANIQDPDQLPVEISNISIGRNVFKLEAIDGKGNKASKEIIINVTEAPLLIITEPNPIEIGYLGGSQDVYITINKNWNLYKGDGGGYLSINGGEEVNGLANVRTKVVFNFDRYDGTAFDRRQTLEVKVNNVLKGTIIAKQQKKLVVGGGGVLDGPPRCFDLESDVLMASGRSKKLKNIVVGDELRVYNFVNKLPSGGEEFRLLSDLMKDATVKTSKVTDFGTQTVEEYRKITLINGEILNVTPSHPILASRDEEEVAWLLPDDLRAGYFVVNKEGKLTEIESKRTIRESLEIGVLQLESGDNYFIENIMVHNTTILRAVARTASRIEAQPIEEVDIIDKR